MELAEKLTEKVHEKSATIGGWQKEHSHPQKEVEGLKRQVGSLQGKAKEVYRLKRQIGSLQNNNESLQVKVESLKCLQEKEKEEARNILLLEAEVQDLQAKACDDAKQIADLRTAATKWHDAKRRFQLKQYPNPSNRNKWARIWLGFALTLVPKLSMYQAEQFVVFLMTSCIFDDEHS